MDEVVGGLYEDDAFAATKGHGWGGGEAGGKKEKPNVGGKSDGGRTERARWLVRAPKSCLHLPRSLPLGPLLPLHSYIPLPVPTVHSTHDAQIPCLISVSVCATHIRANPSFVPLPYIFACPLAPPYFFFFFSRSQSSPLPLLWQPVRSYIGPLALLQYVALLRPSSLIFRGAPRGQSRERIQH